MTREPGFHNSNPRWFWWSLIVLAVVATFLVIIALFTPTTARAEDDPVEPNTEMVVFPQSVEEMIFSASVAYGVDPYRMLRIARCESGFDPFATNRWSGAAGVFQFMPRTWAWASRNAGFAGASPYDATANVWSAAWLMKTSGPRNWVCK